MKKITPPARLAAAFENAGLTDIDVLEFPAGTRSAADAAAAVGSDISDIGKSLVFQAKNSQEPILIIMNGADRVCEKKVKAIIGEPIGKADAAQVRTHTGYAIGGVPPFGHANTLRTLIDEKLLAKPSIWLAAGTPSSVFQLTPDQLCHITGITTGHDLALESK
ncbi:YbaK/EbsC family protein [Thalassospira sp. TSL5-1]|uniref:YbaK/EbsC family protein n=1 Tax=Thalassospira sp. TSL5-1 TaxID=1544451 RepID=UPI00093DFF63|nr:YbaK/EbsC family protein [Thalassospira sp. TSL5-1]OKH88996.1 membrane protein [Thalassospira sp. TSL5-1]